MDPAQLAALLWQYGPTAGLLAAIIFMFRVVMDEDRSSIWRGRIFHGLYKISGRREDEKKYIANDINGRINLARRTLHFGETALPKAIRVEWVEDDKKEGTYDIAEGEFVVRLDPSAGQERNVAQLAMAVVGRTALLGIRPLIELPLQKSFDLNLVRNVLREVGNQKVIDWFYQNEYLPITNQSDITAWNREIVEIDERGLFTRILLVELDAFAKRIAGMVPKPFMSGEIEQLVHFLFRIATKQAGQNVPLELDKAFISIGIILVAKTDKILLEGVEPYLKAMNYNVQQKLNAVYVLIFEKEFLKELDEKAHGKFVQSTNALDQQILNSSLVVKDFSHKYTCVDQQGNKRRAVCTRYLITTA